MPQMTKRQKAQRAKKFAKGIAEGKSQSQAYRETFPTAKDTTVYSHSCRYAKKPEVVAMIEDAIGAITHNDAKSVVKRIVSTAKQTGGDIDRNREMFFKLAGHPAFTSKGTVVNVGNSDNVPDGLATQMATMLDRLEAVATKLDGGKQTDFIDVDCQPVDNGEGHC